MVGALAGVGRYHLDYGQGTRARQRAVIMSRFVSVRIGLDIRSAADV